MFYKVCLCVQFLLGYPAMAPTAAMLILSTHIKPSSLPSSPPPPPPMTHSTSFFGVKFSNVDDSIFKGRYQEKKTSTADPCLADEHSAMEKRFEEALQHSCWC